MFREGEWEEQSQQLKHDLVDHYGVIGRANLININPLLSLPFQEAHMITPSVSLNFIVQSLSEGARFAPTTFRAFMLIVNLTSIVNFQLVVEFNLILHSEGARAPSSVLIVGYRSSKISFHFCNNCRIFSEGDQENTSNGNDTEDVEVVDPQNSNLPSLLSLASAISAQAEIDLSATTASICQISLISISSLIGCNGLVGFIGLGIVSLVGFISLNGHIGLVGHIGHNGLVDVIGLSLIKLSALSNHWLISLISVIGIGVIASSASTASLARRLISISFVSLVGSSTHRLFRERLTGAVFKAT